MSTTRVLFIGGFGRSGSTLLDRMLGQLDGFFSTGELSYVWRMGLLENRLCGCGEPFRDCAFWRDVGLAAFGGWGKLDVDATIALWRAVDRNRYIPFLLAPGTWPAYGRRLARYSALMEQLVGAISDTSGAQVVVDSTKFPSSAYLLRTLSGIDLRVVHLVRDSRGSAYSWTKRTRRPDVTEPDTYMRRLPAVQAGMRWTTRNLAMHGLDRLHVPFRRLRYEDLVASPGTNLRKIAALAGRPIDEQDMDFLSQRTVSLAPGHTVHGNPMRMRSGEVQLQVDEAWRTQMGRAQRTAVAAVTWPLQRAYGYQR